ncbi:lipoprotein releasing system transmembrane protein [Blattabacterium punctulatus CPU2]|uniref:Lipoprotein releasing system transmembrane protein n=1 Tax=Blattabacterium punctulatus CPU2 TaxID=1457032 RepID=A0AAD1CMQ0_9FLAO|nr:FtsX-like permease family protein [Blattabacterium punctulatus]AWU39079.1 ABC transporter permease [Blattabacterium punctulatus]BBA18046.1 lipoprotein releasing system transmembrane protein [Blattabacterium punctulatus CPU2]
MNPSFYIAIRYFFSKKKNNIVNIIIFLSILSLSISTFSLSSILSIFSGVKNLNIKFYQNNYPDIILSDYNKKNILINDQILKEKMKSIKGIFSFSKTIEKKVYLYYKNNKYFFYLKGVDSEYGKVMKNFKKIVFIKKNKLFDKKLNIYIGLSYFLPFFSLLFFDKIEKNPIKIIYFFFDKKKINNPPIIIQKEVKIKGLFHFNQEIDNQYLFCDISEIQKLIKKKTFHFLEIKIHKNENINNIKNLLKKKLGSKYMIQTRIEKEKAFLKIINTEKIFIYFLLFLISLIAGFNLISAIFILQLDKKENIFILCSFGYSLYRIKKIFFYIGFIITFSGCFLGICISYVTSFLQEKYHIFKIGGKFPFPVKFTIEDFYMTTCIILTIGIIISFFSSKRMNYLLI